MVASGTMVKKKTTGRPPRTVLTDDETKLIAFRKQGLSHSEIAAKMKKTKEWVDSAAARLVRSGNLEKRSTGRKYDPSINLDSLDRKLIGWREKGLTASEMAEKLQKDVFFVNNRIGVLIEQGRIEKVR